jgi:two-component system, LytTR family, sensor kinase
MDAFANRKMNQTPTYTQSFEAEGLDSLHLQTFSGDIELVGHDENSIKVEVFIWDRDLLTLFLMKDFVMDSQVGAEQVAFSHFGSTLKIVSKFKFSNIFNFRRTSFKVYLPASIFSKSKTYNGQIVLKNLSGNHQFTSWGGDLLVQNSQGNLFGKTMGGDIEVSNSEGQIKMNTMGGDILLRENQANINVDTKGGSIHVQKNKGQIHFNSWGGNIEASDIIGDFECSTLGGNIRLNNLNGNIGASTKGGNITAQLSSINQYAWFDTSGGNIRVSLPLENPMDLEVSANRIYHPSFQNFKGNISRNSIRGKLNGGGSHITIKTGGGKVDIENYNKPAESVDYQDFTNKIFENNFQSNKVESKIYEKSKERFVPASDNKPLVWDIKNALFTLAFCVLLVYGMSSITYFTLEFFNPKSILSSIYKGIFYTNINNGIGAMVSVSIFIYFYEYKIRSNVWKYVALFGMTSIYSVVFQMVIGYLYWSKLDPELWREDANNYGFIYLIIPQIAACVYFYYWQRTRNISRKMSEQEYQLLNLEKLKSKAQLDALEARINPHFLYNSLNSIAGLIHEKPDKAEEMTIQLSKLFRYTTGRDEENLHTFADELEIIKAYLAIEQVRFGKRLTYTIDCDEAVLEQQIPRFLLQPLVENAIKHGISKIAHAGEITLKIKQLENNILIKIHDNGPAFGESFGGGFGLRSIKEKLEIVFGNKATIDLKNEPEKAVVITMARMMER